MKVIFLEQSQSDPSVSIITAKKMRNVPRVGDHVFWIKAGEYREYEVECVLWGPFRRPQVAYVGITPFSH